MSNASRAVPMSASRTRRRSTTPSESLSEEERPKSREPSSSSKRQRFSRSKRGCLTCKRQKKKCDEERPSCTRCALAKRFCEYPPGEPAFTPSEYGYSIQQPHQMPSPSYGTHTQSYSATPGPSRLTASPLDLITTMPQPPSTGFADSFFGHLATWKGITPATANSTTSPSANPSLVLSVPIDCDAELWQSFVGSSLWDSREVTTGEDAGLLEYFVSFASVTVVARSEGAGAERSIFQIMVNRAKDGVESLLRCLLCVSALHVANLARACNDEVRAHGFFQEARRHRSIALRILRVQAAENTSTNDAVMPAVTALLVLSAILEGDADMVPIYIQRCADLLERTTDPDDVDLYVSAASFYSMYAMMHAVSRGRQVEAEGIFPPLAVRQSSWSGRFNTITETIAGASSSMLVLFLQSQAFALENHTITAALRRDPSDGELQFMELEVKAKCKALETELNDAQGWKQRWLDGFEPRTRLGHEAFRLAIRVTMLVEIFGISGTHSRVQNCVFDLLALCSQVGIGQEIGFSWPWLIVFSEALGEDRGNAITFIKRCQWKGSASPRICEELIIAIWARRDATGRGTWREEMRERSCPFII